MIVQQMGLFYDMNGSLSLEVQLENAMMEPYRVEVPELKTAATLHNLMSQSVLPLTIKQYNVSTTLVLE